MAKNELLEDRSEPKGPPPVEVGTMLFTMVEPHEGHVVAYNDWYERDHQFGGATVGAHIFSNRRWLATKALKNLRFPAAGGILDDVRRGSFLATYWKEKDHADIVERWSRDQWHWLNERGRIWRNRDHIHTDDYRVLSVAREPGERVPLELALLHPFSGLLVMMISKPEEGQSQLIEKLEAIAADTIIGKGVAILSTWEQTWPGGFEEALLVPTASKAEPVLVQLGFMRTSPDQIWSNVQDYARRIEAELGQSVRLAAGFIPTVPGTTEHLDEL